MFLLGRKTPEMLGLDISSTAVKLQELIQSSGRGGIQYKVESYGVEPLPAESVVEKNISDVEAVGESIKNVVKRSGTKTKKASVSVAGSAFITRIIMMKAGL